MLRKNELNYQIALHQSSIFFQKEKRKKERRKKDMPLQQPV